MNIAELFVNLGIKGAEKTVGSLTEVKKSVTEVGQMSLEAKAGLVGLAYEFQHLMHESGVAGTAMSNFNQTTGISTKMLQEYQYAARQAGVSNQETAATFKTLQGSMAKVMMGQAAPKGLAMVSAMTGGITAKDIQDFAAHPEKLWQKLQEYAQKDKNVGRANEVLKSFGVSDDMVAAMRKNVFTDKNFSRAPTYSDSEVGKLDKANIAWSNLGQHIEMAFGHFNAKHGTQLVGDISKVVDSLTKLTESFTILAEKLKFFQFVSKIFDGWNLIFQQLSGGVKGASDTLSGPDRTKNIAKGIGNSIYSGLKFMAVSSTGLADAIVPPSSGLFAPKAAAPVSIQQIITHHGNAKDTQAVKDTHKTAVNHAYRQMSAQTQVN